MIRPLIIICIILFNLSAETFSIAGPFRDWIAGKDNAESRNDIQTDDDSLASNFNLPAGAKLLKDISYGTHPKQKFDVYVPEKTVSAPVIFMVHGGAWRAGDKAAGGVVENKAKRWVPKGFIFVSANYRLLPDADPLTQASDVASAIAKAQSLAKDWGGDPSRFILMGHSAGAHLVSLVSSSRKIESDAGMKPFLGTVVLDSAAYDIERIMKEKHYRFYDKAFGKDQNYWKSASPFHVIFEGAKPFLSVCSTARPDNPCLQAGFFSAKAKSLGVSVDLLSKDLNHADINRLLGFDEEYTSSVEAFMASLDANVKAHLIAK